MATSQGPCDHPSYIVRTQIFLGKTTAGANGTSQTYAPTNNMRLRNVSAVVVTSGTSSGAGNQVIVGCVGTCTTFTTGVGTQGTGTTTLGTVVLGSSTAGSVGTSGDLNVVVNAGSFVYLKNGTDATGVANVAIEAHVDPLATWLITSGG